MSSVATDDISRMDSHLITLARMLQLSSWTTVDPVGRVIRMGSFHMFQLDSDGVGSVVMGILVINVDADRLNVVMEVDRRVLVDLFYQDCLDTMLSKQYSTGKTR